MAYVTTTGQPSFLERVVEIPDFCGDAECVSSSFRVLTSIGGFVNDFHGLAKGPNAQLVCYPANGRGQRFLFLKVTKQIPKGREVLISYNNVLWFEPPELLVGIITVMSVCSQWSVDSQG